MNVVLTGVTGTLGSRVLYELLEQQSEHLENIYLLVRAKNQLSPHQRVDRVLQSPFAPDYIKDSLPPLLQKIHVVDFSKMPEPATFLNKSSSNCFIHSAGYVNLSINGNGRTEVFRENLLFTKQVFDTFHRYIDKFVYISTAFSAGDREGCLSDDYLHLPLASYRNHYEEAKHQTEKFLVEEGAQKGISVQILRPSVLGGNVIDQPNYFIAKYMVFYLFAKFFYRAGAGEKVRIALNADATLNIIPTDYAAKVIARVFKTNVQQLNIVHRKGTHVAKGIATILDTVQFKKYRLIHRPISGDYQTNLEAFYYQTIGKHLSPYLHAKPHSWDTSLLERVLPIPAYDLDEYIINTIEFAKSRNFKNERW